MLCDIQKKFHGIAFDVISKKKSSYIYSMLPRSLLISLLFFAKVHFYEGCSSNDDKKYSSPDNYDINNPVKINLPVGLDEISGLSYYPKDSSVFAIVDEDGILFKISLNGNNSIKEWRFDKKHDFEDIVMHDSTFYILISNGDIESLKFIGDSIYKTKSEFPNAGKKTNEFEALYYDDASGLSMMCKNCEDDGKKVVSVLGYLPDSSTYKTLFTIDVKAIAKSIGEDKLHFKPSAAAINPVNNELFILSSVNKLLVVADKNGVMKKVYPLNPDMFNQPEGITFTPKGDLIISNELGEKSAATLLIFKRKK